MRRHEFTAVMRQAISELPLPIRRALRNVVIELHERPSRRILQEAGLRRADDLFGWYEGTPLTERGTDYGMVAPDRILIFQRPIESACRKRHHLIEQIQITVRHEVGHHLGLDEEALDQLGLG